VAYSPKPARRDTVNCRAPEAGEKSEKSDGLDQSKHSSVALSRHRSEALQANHRKAVARGVPATFGLHYILPLAMLAPV